MDVRSTASIQTFRIPSKAAGARPGGWCALPMQQSCSACSLFLSSISARRLSIWAGPAPSRPPRSCGFASLYRAGQPDERGAGPRSRPVKRSGDISPEQDNIVATYMRALADVAGRTAELRIKARVAQETLEASRTYLRVTEEAAKRVDTMATATMTFRMEVLRERAAAQKGRRLARGGSRRSNRSTRLPR